jgi:Holliday junction resolvasome RuvABC ATP-dependent DNA helicase subunit
VFIDEAHAINKVLTVPWLLSAMDEARKTSFAGTKYDFSNVSFLLATTDYGRLPETLRSRADPIYLRPYTLPELAGIIWFHGKSRLGDYDLPYEVCMEIAARVAAQPRRAVKAIKEHLPAHAFAQLAREGQTSPTQRSVGQRINIQLVSAFYDRQGVDSNGIGNPERSVMRFLAEARTPQAEQRIRQAVGISNPQDFNEIEAYLTRLGLMQVGTRGRSLTEAGLRYATERPNLRDRISRYRDETSCT